MAPPPARRVLPPAHCSLPAARSVRGYTLLEVVVALSIFGVFLLICTQLTREMTGYEKKLPVTFLVHPQVSAVISRMRKDVLDATAPYYPAGYESYTQGSKTLILYTLRPTGFAETVVWDFSTPGEVHRRSYNVGVMSSEWIARGLPAEFLVQDFPIDGHPDSVRIVAHDNHGLIAIDQIFQPRPHE